MDLLLTIMNKFYLEILRSIFLIDHTYDRGSWVIFQLLPNEKWLHDPIGLCIIWTVAMLIYLYDCFSKEYVVHSFNFDVKSSSGPELRFYYKFTASKGQQSQLGQAREKID